MEEVLVVRMCLYLAPLFLGWNTVILIKTQRFLSVGTRNDDVLYQFLSILLKHANSVWHSKVFDR